MINKILFLFTVLLLSYCGSYRQQNMGPNDKKIVNIAINNSELEHNYPNIRNHIFEFCDDPNNKFDVDCVIDDIKERESYIIDHLKTKGYGNINLNFFSTSFKGSKMYNRKTSKFNRS